MDAQARRSSDKLATRRLLLQMALSLFGGNLVRGAKPFGLGLRLVREFKNAQLLDVSADGARICLLDLKAGGYTVKILETDVWRTSFRERLGGAFAVYFLPDGHHLLVDSAFLRPHTHRLIVIDTKTGKRAISTFDHDPLQVGVVTRPLDDGILLMQREAMKPNPHQLESLSRVEFPGYRELASAEEPLLQKNSPFVPDVALAGSRVCVAGDCLTCLRALDLKAVWSHRIAGGIRASPLALSSRGGYLAALMNSTAFTEGWEYDTPLYVAVYDSTTGVELGRIPSEANPNDPTTHQRWIAVSNNGAFVVIAQNVPIGDQGDLAVTAQLYNVLSGEMLASVVHDRIPKGHRQFLLAGCTVRFTPDDKYLVTSSRHTKLWSVDLR